MMAWPRDYFPPSRPIATRGGIRSRSKRGAFATTSWGRRWLSVLESLNLGGRLQRGRSYARQGQVVDIHIESGSVRASVQGSRARPYAITIEARKLTTRERQQVGAALGSQAWLLAKLLARELPAEVEEVFASTGAPLFPARAAELKTECSCPDWSNPCKHIAAVFYLLSEEFDRDPFLILRLRGVEVDALLDAAGVAAELSPDEIEESSRQDTATPLDAVDSFWDGPRPEVDLFVPDARTSAPLLRRLGNLPFWRSERTLVEALEGTYAAAAARALEALAGDESSSPSSEAVDGGGRGTLRKKS
jgi:uncharacterized Zn finger protein